MTRIIAWSIVHHAIVCPARPVRRQSAREAMLVGEDVDGGASGDAEFDDDAPQMLLDGAGTAEEATPPHVEW